MASDDEHLDIMISLHVGTMKASAMNLKETLEAKGLKVWLCSDELSGGDSYRKEIVWAVKKCKVFLPLINDAWGLSGECEDEYSLAKRLNLTSHESKRTKRSEKRLPILMPIAFSDLDWTAHAHVELLAASTNFIVHPALNLTEGPLDATLNQLFSSLSGCGYKISELPQHPKPRPTPEQATAQQQEQAAAAAKEKNTTLGKEYQGTVYAPNNALASGEAYEYCDSVLLKLEYNTETNACTGTMKVDSIMKRVDGYEKAEDVPEDHVLCGWVNEEDHEVHTFEGTFNPLNKFLSLRDTETTGDDSNMKVYSLVMYEDRLIGVQQALVDREDLDDPTATEPLNLVRVL